MHCFNESAPLANIFDCMKGHNRKLNRLRERGSTMATALSGCKTGFPAKRIGVGEGGRVGGGQWGGCSGVGGGVSVNPRGSQLRCQCSPVHTPFTQHPTVHNRPRNWWVTAPSNSYAPSITGFNQGGREKLEKEMEGDRQWKGQTPGGGACFITHIITSLIATQAI